MTGKEFIQQFESGNIAPPDFHHADHVRLAFAYLQQYTILEALQRFSLALKRFAASLGKADRYHETITYAYFFLVRERMAQVEALEWDEFAKANPDLLVWKNGILNRYYQERTLNSELARRVFILPDKCA